MRYATDLLTRQGNDRTLVRKYLKELLVIFGMWEHIFFVLSQFESTNVLVVGNIMTLSTCSSFIKKIIIPKPKDGAICF